MEETKRVDAGQPLSEQQVKGISGGTSEVNTTTASTDAIVSIYNGLVDLTSHIIERVANSAK